MFIIDPSKRRIGPRPMVPRGVVWDHRRDACGARNEGTRPEPARSGFGFIHGLRGLGRQSSLRGKIPKSNIHRPTKAERVRAFREFVDKLCFFEEVCGELRVGAKVRRRSWPEGEYLIKAFHDPYNMGKEHGKLCVHRIFRRESTYGSFEAQEWKNNFIDLMANDWEIIE